MFRSRKSRIYNLVNVLIILFLVLFSVNHAVSAGNPPPGDVPISSSNFVNSGENGNAYTTVDNAGPDGLPPADGDMDVYLFDYDYQAPIEFNIWLDSLSDVNFPTLNLYAYDIDETSGERDEVYINDHFLGTLTGANGQWSTTVLPIKPVFLKEGNNLIRIEIDVLYEGNWAVTVDWGQIVTNNQSGPAFIRSIELDNTSYLPGEIVSATVEVDTTLATQGVKVEVNLIDPDWVVLDGYSQTYTLSGILDDPHTWNLGLPTDAAGGYYVQVLVYDLASSLLQATEDKAFTVSGSFPIIFIPGIMGSRLHNYEDGEEQEIWVNPLKILQNAIPIINHPLDVLRLDSNGIDPAKEEPAYETVHVKEGISGLVTKVDFGVGEFIGKIIKHEPYEYFINHFTEDLGYQLEQDIWVFPYDWRKDLTTSATELGKLVDKVRSQTGTSQVYLIAHSMGGLVAREYISEPTQASNIRRAIILGTPFLGTPEAYEVLRVGKCLIKLPIIGCLLNESITQALSPNFPAFYQLMPSPEYFVLKGGGFYIENFIKSPIGICPTCLSEGDTYSSEKVPLINNNIWKQAKVFHAEIDGTISVPNNWNDVPVTLVVGINKSTIMGIREYEYYDWPTLQKVKVVVPVYSSAGDGTVTQLSASLYGRDTGRSLAGGATYAEFSSDHGDLVKNDEVLEYIDEILGLTSSTTSSTTSSSIQTIQPELDSAQIIAYGVESIDVVDSFGNHTGPSPYDSEESEELIPGSAYFHSDQVTIVALIEGQNYAITITPKGDELVDINLSRSTFDKVISQSLYLGVDVQKETRIVMVGDPLIVDGWTIDVYGTGEEIIDLNPTTELGEEQPTDITPPTVTIELDGTIGPSGWYTSPVLVTLNGADNEGGVGLSRIEYAFSNDRTVRTYSGPFVVSPEAVGVIYALGVDFVGNAQVEASFARIGPEKTFLPLTTR